MTTLELAVHESMTIELPGGRTLHLWAHDCDSCTSVDVWTTRGNEVEEISKQTGDTSRAPTGIFAWRNGGRHTLNGPEPVDCSNGWPAVGTVTLIWNDHKEK